MGKDEMRRRLRSGMGKFIGLFGILPAMLAQPAFSDLHPAIRNYDYVDLGTAAALPQRLSEAGLYSNIGTKARTIADTNSIVYFEVNSPLWSDGTHKERYISLPPGGAKVIPTDTSKFVFPEKTVLIKNFSIDTVHGDPNTRILIETRFLVHRKTEEGTVRWSGISYMWLRNQTDAVLAPTDTGMNAIHNVRLNGTSVGMRWRYPSSTNCVMCHRGNESAEDARGTLGFITPQLNRTMGTVNQLQRLVSKGVLASNPVANKPNAHRWYAVNEATGTLEQKARSYLAANCSHCHGNPTIGPPHNFDYLTPDVKTAIEDNPDGGYVGKDGGGQLPKFVYAGHPDSSNVLLRMMARGSFEAPSFEQMPPLATYLPDSAAITVVKNWICSLKPGSPCDKLPEPHNPEVWDTPVPGGSNVSSIRGHGFHGAKGIGQQARIRGGILEIRNLAGSAEAALFDVRGRAIPLAEANSGSRADTRTFRILAPMQPGVYLLKAGSRVLRLQHLP
jgi:hypothetical protein